MPYEERYVAFADILGFSNIVRKTEPDSATQNSLDEILAMIGSREGRPDEIVGVDFQFQAFSDSIVMSTKTEYFDLRYLLAQIRDLSLHLLGKGLLLRGAVARGKLYHSRGVMFGPAFLKAYHVERTIAKYPRVVLSREVRHHLEAFKSATNAPEILLGDDGPPYLHVFGHFRRPKEGSESPDPGKIRVAEECQRQIQRLLYESIYDPKHYEKLRWLAIYWNSTIANFASLRPIIFPQS
jgi:hypothetical protein